MVGSNLERRLRIALAWAMDSCETARAIVASAPGPLAYGALMQRLYACDADHGISVDFDTNGFLRIRASHALTSISWCGRIPETESEMTGEAAA